MYVVKICENQVNLQITMLFKFKTKSWCYKVLQIEVKSSELHYDLILFIEVHRSLEFHSKFSRISAKKYIFDVIFHIKVRSTSNHSPKFGLTPNFHVLMEVDIHEKNKAFIIEFKTLKFPDPIRWNTWVLQEYMLKL